VIVVVEQDMSVAESLRANLGAGTTVQYDMDALRRYLDTHPDTDAVVVGPSMNAQAAFRLADTMRIRRPALGVVLVRKRLDTALLGDALRSGVREVVAERDDVAVREAVERALQVSRALREGHLADEQVEADLGRLTTVFSAKGGCGKTTLSTNVAAALADNGRRQVCLVDLDLAFGDVAIAMQLFPAHTLADAVPLGDTLDADAVHQLLTPHSPGLSVLPAPVEPGAADSIPAGLVGNLLHVLRGMFDHVVVDTPPAFTDHVLAAFDESDVIALIATLDVPALKNLKLTVETLDLLNYPRERWRVVLNRADSKVGLALGEVEKTLNVPIAAQIPSSRAVPAAINRGVPIVLDDGHHAVSQAIKRFAEAEIVDAAMLDRAIPKQLRNDRRSFIRRKAKHS
jgi:pilus assembly protein CpaE